MEEKILKQLIKNPEKGLEKLMETYAGLVYSIVYNKVNHICSKEDIEECVSSVFFEVYEKRHQIDLLKGTVKAYTAVIAKRRAIDLFRKKEKEAGKIISLQEYDFSQNDQTNTNGLYERKSDFETKELLIDSIKALGEPDKEIFVRKFYFGQKTRTIAALMGIKENTIDKRISRGLVKLREIIYQTGNGESEGV